MVTVLHYTANNKNNFYDKTILNENTCPIIGMLVLYDLRKI